MPTVMLIQYYQITEDSQYKVSSSIDLTMRLKRTVAFLYCLLEIIIPGIVDTIVHKTVSAFTIHFVSTYLPKVRLGRSIN